MVAEAPWVVLVQHISSEYKQMAADAEIIRHSDKTKCLGEILQMTGN